MNIRDILSGAAAIAGTLHPGVGAAIGLVNKLLPADKQLPETATGADVSNAVDKLPPDQQAAIYQSEIELQVVDIQESNSTVRTMLESDAMNQHSTRPYIAKQSFHVVAFAVIISVATWAYAVISGKAVMVESVMDGWPFLLAVLGPLVVLLHAYFGVLRSEHKNRLDAARGVSSPSALSGIISKIIK
jgi:hypothetical protein